jgi:hypothetical protein
MGGYGLFCAKIHRHMHLSASSGPAPAADWSGVRATRSGGLIVSIRGGYTYQSHHRRLLITNTIAGTFRLASKWMVKSMLP